MSRRTLDRTHARRIASKLAVALASLVVISLAAELGHRASLRLSGDPYDRERAEGRLRQLAARSSNAQHEVDGVLPAEPADTPGRVFHPYTGGETRYDPHGVLAHLATQPKDEYTVVLTGGSVAEFLAFSGTRQSRAVTAGLAADPRLAGRTPVLLDYAHWAYKQPQQLARVLHLFQLGLRPDVVVELDGANELTGAADNAETGTDPGFPSYQLWGFLVDVRAGDDAQEDRIHRLWQTRGETRRWLEGALDSGVCASSLAARFVLARALLLQSQGSRLTDQIRTARHSTFASERIREEAQGPPRAGIEGASAAAIAESWFASSLAIDAACRARGVRYVHLLQPNLHYAKPLAPGERALIPAGGGIGPRIREGYPLLREKGARLVARGVEFVDLSTLFEHEEQHVYCDEFHVADRGNDLLAEAVIEALRAGAIAAGGSR